MASCESLEHDSGKYKAAGRFYLSFLDTWFHGKGNEFSNMSHNPSKEKRVVMSVAL